MGEDKCFHCGSSLGFNEERVVVRKAVKPRSRPHRWVRIGCMCESCDSKGKEFAFDEWAEHTKDVDKALAEAECDARSLHLTGCFSTGKSHD
jgi:hypothetical protein